MTDKPVPVSVAENGNGKSSNVLGLINSGAIALLVAVSAGFWSLADPRGEIRSIREGYLSLREHNEFRDRVRQDIDRIETNQQKLMLPRTEFELWKNARGDLVTARELAAQHVGTDIAIQSMRRELDQIDKAVNARFGLAVGTK